MSKTAQRTDPKLWDKVKSKVTRSGKAGEPGQWSARKAQLAVQEYKKRGGGYLGKQSADNSLKQWSDEDRDTKWSDEDRDTKSGRGCRRAGERYLPKKADADYGKANSEKRADTKKGKRASSKREGVAEKTAQQRSTSKSPTKMSPNQNKDELLKQARYLDIEGRSNMLKTELQEAIRLAKH